MRYIPGYGPTDARIAFIGEAPGGEEELAGKPFVGPAGHELTRMCHDAGIVRNECWVTNVVRFRPPGNDLSAWIQPMKRNRTYPSDFIPFQGRMVAPFVKDHITDLWNELKALQPNVIIPLGNYPLWALTGEESISLWRGSILEAKCEGIDGLKTIPTYHPAGIMRNWPWREDAVQDLRRALGESSSAFIHQPGWDFTIRPSYDAAMAILEWLLARLNQGESVQLSVDIETIPSLYQITCLGIAWSKTKALCIPFFHNEGDRSYWSAEQELSIILLLRQILLHENVRILGHNFLYDATFQAFVWGHKCLPTDDTMVAQHVCWPGKEKALDYISSIYCDYYRFWKEDGKEWRLKGNEEQLWRYNCMDCVYAWECLEVLQRIIDKRNLREQYNFQMSLCRPVLDMVIRGVRLNPAHRNNLHLAIETEIQNRQDYIDKAVGFHLNTRSNPQLKKFFYDDLRIKPAFQRKTHTVAVDDAALDTIKKREPILGPITTRIQECRSLSVFKSNVLKATGPADRMFTSFKITGAETFRWASSKNPFGWGTNLQNIPQPHEENAPEVNEFAKNIRRLFIPDPGKLLCEFDLERADLQVVVWEAEDDELKQLLRAGADIHRENSQVIGFSRDMSKRFLHLTNYGGKARTAAISCGITTHEAEVAQRRWFQKHPGILSWHKRTEQALLSTRTICNRFGYKRFYFDRPGSEFTEALAWVPQSTVGIVINKVLMEIYNSLPEVDILIQVHDSLVLQFDIPLLTSIQPKIKACFNRVVVPYEDPLVIPASCKLSTKSWGDCVSEKDFQTDKFERVQIPQLV